jgi:hypothetical protein
LKINVSYKQQYKYSHREKLGSYSSLNKPECLDFRRGFEKNKMLRIGTKDELKQTL